MTAPRQLIAGAVVAFVVIHATGQFERAFHAHDDWFMHLSIAPQRFLWYAETEGRWLTFLWSHLSRHFAPNQTFLLSAALHAVSTAAFTVNTYAGGRPALVFLALFFSPFIAAILQWSAQQVAALTILAVVSVSLLSAKPLHLQLLLAGLGQTAGFLSYAGVAPLILLQLTVRSSGASRDLALRLSTFPAALAVGTLIMLGMNGVMSGTFALPVAEWRAPDPATDLSSGLANLGHFWTDQWQLLTSTPSLAFLVAASTALAFGDRRARPRTRVVLAAAAMILAYEGAVTVATGVSVPPRARAWLWAAPIMLCVGGLDAASVLRRWGTVLVMTMCLLAGASYWIQYYREAQRALDQVNALVARAEALKGPRDRVVFHGGKVPIDRAGYRLFTVNRDVRWFVDYAHAVHGLQVEPCVGHECVGIASHRPGEVVFRLEAGVVAFRFDEQ